MMSQPPGPNSASDELQFTTAEPADSVASDAASGRKCAVCHRPIEATYYAIADQVICPACQAQLTAPVAGTRFGRLLKASLLGLGAGLVGALIWFIIRRVTHLEIGLVAILVGFMVGKAVHFGSRGRGGLGYQTVAVLITYCCIALNYVPDIFEAILEADRQQQAAAAELVGDAAAEAKLVPAEGVIPEPVNPQPDEAEAVAGVGEFVMFFAIVFAIALAAPFLAGVENLIGLLIIGFALWEAWKFNARRPLPISGPYQLGTSPASG